MRSSLSLPLLALGVASSVNAIGIIDNLVTHTKVLASAVTFEGTYVVQNVKTGQYLNFNRPGDTTNVHTTKEYATIELTHGGAKGFSGVNFGSYSGTIITGLTKCGSAQWGNEGGLGVDVAFVSYACAVGDDPNGTDTLEVAKQFWRIVPCGSSDESRSSGAVQLNAKVAVKGDSAASATWSSEAAGTTAAPDATPASDDDSAFVPQTTLSVNSYDQTTWVCRHPGWWLARHPDYITDAGHVECKDDLEAYKASLKKRSTHAQIAKRIRNKRAPASGRYCIIAEDHLLDMQTRSVGDQVVSSFGGYTSQALVDWDASDIGQQWDIYAA